MRKKLLPVLLTLALAVALLTVGALADASDNVIYVNANDTTADTETGVGTASNPYNSLDAAVDKAPDGSVIEILSDVTTDGLELRKDLTIRGGMVAEGTEKYTIKFVEYGIALWGKSLTFENCNVEMDGIGSTPYTAEWDWMTICASAGASMTLNNVNMTMDAEGTTNSPHAIYFCNDNVLNIENGSVLEIKNYPNDALEWDGGNGGYNVNITDSTFISDHNRSGFTGTFYATITDSKVNVINSTGNGSNGTNFIIRTTADALATPTTDDNTVVNFNDNGDHGLSAGTLTIDHSQVTATGNGANGVHTNNTFTVKNNSVLTIQNNDCGIVSPWTLPAALHIGAGESSIDSTSTITITNNEGPGMLLKSGSLTVADGAKLTITNNEARVFNDDGVLSDGFGGGIINKGTMTLPANPDDIVIYNNHAENAGDDIYSTGTLTFGTVGTTWRLDGEPDCTDAIDGWYDDSEDNRWEAHAKTTAGNHIDLISNEDAGVSFDEATGLYTVTGLHAYKAAHGIIPITITPADIIIYMGGNDGYDGVANGSGTITASNTLPTPGFTFSGFPEGTDPTDIIFSGAGERAWHVELYPGLSEDGVHKLYTIVPSGTENQDPVRVQFKVGENDYVVSDEFIVGLEVNTSFEMSIYPGNAGEVSATIDGQAYTVELGSGILTVRGVTENPAYAEVEVTGTAQTAGEPGLTAPENTVFYVNGSEVQLTDEGSVALLFDDIIDTGSENRTEQLVDRAEQEIGAFDSYEAKYLDLVDRNNGDAWVTASNAVTVYWPLPEGTNRFTDFTLLHFEDLDRDMASDEIENDIANCVVDEIEITEVTGTHVVFNVTSGNFSPFMLVWDTDGGDEPVIPPVRPTDPVRPQEPDGLNTEDHVAYIIGYPDGEVKPEGNITRAEVATIFFRLLTDETREEYWSQTNGYTDVARDAWYNNAISTLSNLGIIDGYEDGSFRPNSPITRAEFTKIAVSFFEYADIEYEGTFSDVAEGRWYTQFVAAAVEMGLIEGYPDGTFRPDASITRAEACTIVNRTLGRAPHEDHLLPEEEMITWPDNLYGAWYYADMQEATNSHDYEWTTEDSERVEDWTEKLPERDWDALEEIWSEANDAPGGEVIG
mgnify:FL=1